MTDRQMQQPEQSVSPDRSPRTRRIVVPTVVFVVCAALVTLPTWTVVFAGAQWPLAAQLAGSAVALAVFVALPAAMSEISVLTLVAG